MGTTDADRNPGDGEAPVRPVSVEPFSIGAYAVSNRQFGRFVADTGYRTDAERLGDSYVVASFLPGPVADRLPRVAAAPWWAVVPGACWLFPEGPDSTVSDRLDHPVVHVAWTDAQAYCEWAGARLPTDRDWEYAATFLPSLSRVRTVGEAWLESWSPRGCGCSPSRCR